MEWDELRLECTLDRVPQPAGRSSILPDERLLAAIVVSGALQVLFIIYAVLAWTETPERVVATSNHKNTRVDAVVRQVYEPDRP